MPITLSNFIITFYSKRSICLARKYAKGIPKRARSNVEIEAELRLRTKASHSSGLVRESSSLVGSAKVSIEASGKTIYATVIPDKISTRMLKP